MTQQSHSQAYARRKPKLKKTQVPHYTDCSTTYNSSNTEAAQMPINRRMDREVLVHIHTGLLLSHQRSTFESVLMRWMNLESIIQSEVSQKQKDKYHILMDIYRIQKNATEEFIYRAAVEKQTQRIDLWTWGEGRRLEGEMYGKSDMETYIPICKIDS